MEGRDSQAGINTRLRALSLYRQVMINTWTSLQSESISLFIHMEGNVLVMAVYGGERPMEISVVGNYVSNIIKTLEKYNLC